MRTLIALCVVVISGCSAPSTLVPPTVDEDPSIPSVELNGTRFRWLQSGASAGTPVIFLHGGPGNDSAYISRLGGRCPGGSIGDAHPLFFWDQRGSGGSRRHGASELRLDVFRADLDAVVDFVDPERRGVILVGHSWGGGYAVDYLSRHPDRVRGAALLEPNALTAELNNGFPNAGTVDLSEEWVNDLVWSEELLTPDEHAVADLHMLIAVKDAQTFREELEPIPTYRLGAAVIQELISYRFFPEDYHLARNARAFEGEVLIVASDDEGGDLSVDFQRRQLAFFSNPTLRIVEGGGHNDLAHGLACESVAHILEYLERIEP